MSYARCLQGLGSGATYPADRVMNTCPVHGRPVVIRYDLDRLRSDRPIPPWYHPTRTDMWRFGGLLPLDVDDPADRSHVVSRGEGATPRLDYPDHPAAQRGSFRLQIKDEGRYGADGNPTGSFKDRGMAVVVSMARRLGLDALAVPTQGNAGDALATYGVAAGLEVGVAMPRDTDRPILGNVAALATLHDGVDLTVVEGTIREAGTAVEQTYLAQDYFLVATFQEPGWRIEGKKTMGLELAEPAAPDGEWSLPDVIVYPTGGGTGLLGMWKAFEELEALGLIGEERPRMVAVQSTETAPIVEAFRRGDADTTPVEPGDTMATGLNVADGIGHFKVLDILYESDGHALAVSDAATAAALRRTYHEKGWWICPEGAACLAALDPLVDRGVIQPGDDVVVFNTASLEKYLPAVRHLL
jgi:threonine synthase